MTIYYLLAALSGLIALAGIVRGAGASPVAVAKALYDRRRLDALATTEDRDFHLQS